jgi:hypothetical protein
VFYEKRFLKALKAYYSQYNPVTELWHGGASGADREAAMWAAGENLLVRPFIADWSKGKNAGIIRNGEMAKGLLDASDISLVIAFPGGAGTNHMWETCQNRGLNCIRYNLNILSNLENSTIAYDSLLPF